MAETMISLTNVIRLAAQAASETVTSVASTSTQKRTVAVAMAFNGSVTIIVLIVAWLVSFLVNSLLIIDALDAAEERRDPRIKSIKQTPTWQRLEADANHYADQMNEFIPLVGGAWTAIFTTIAGGVLEASVNAISVGSSIAPLYIGVALFFAITSAVWFYSDVVAKGMAISNAALHFQFYWDTILIPLFMVVMDVYYIAYGALSTLIRTMNWTKRGWIIVLLECSIPYLGQIFTAAAQVILNFVTMLVFWFFNNPFATEIPAAGFFAAVQNLVTVFYSTSFMCFCSANQYFVGGIVKNFNSTSLTIALTSAVNIPSGILITWIINPIRSQTFPNIRRVWTLTANTFDYFAAWLQEDLVVQFDIYLYQGNGTLVAYVNGSLPMPGTYFDYAIRALRIQWASTVASLALALLALSWFEPLNLIFQSPQIFTENGYEQFEFEMLTNSTIDFFDNIETVFDTLPQCNNDGYFQVSWGDFISIFRWLVYVLKAAVQMVIREAYFLIAYHRAPLYASAGYFMQNKLPLLLAEKEINRTGSALGCGISYLSPAAGSAIRGLFNTIFTFVPRVLFELVVYIRVAAFSNDPNAIDALSIDQLRDGLLQTAELGEIFYEFSNYTMAQCQGVVSLWCNLGNGTEYLFDFILLLLIVAIEFVAGTSKTIIMQIQTQATFNLTIPDLDLLMTSAYGAACNLGASVGAAIGPGVQCLVTKPGFCSTRQFPSIAIPTISSCAGGAFCDFAIAFIVPLDVVITGIRNIQYFSPGNDSQVAAVKEYLTIYVYNGLAWICPFAHWVNCVVSAATGTNGTAISELACTITAGLVQGLAQIGSFIFQLAQWVVSLFLYIWGGFRGGDSTTTLWTLVTQFFAIVGASIAGFAKLVVSAASAGAIAAISSLCYLLDSALPTSFSVQSTCETIANSTNQILGGGNVEYGNPAFQNYKRDTSHDTDARFNANPKLSGAKRAAQGCKTRTIEITTSQFLIRNLERMLRDYPGLGLASEMLKFAAEARGIPLEGEAPKSKRDTSPEAWTEDMSPVYKFLATAILGDLTNLDPEQLTHHLFNNVQWSKTSECYHVLDELQDKKWSELSALEHSYVRSSCITPKALAVVIAKSIPLMSWLPEDIFYNPLYRTQTMALYALRIMLVTTQWASDTTVPMEVIMTSEYQEEWEHLGLDVSFYNGTWAAFWDPSLPLEEQPELAIIRSQRTLLDYLRANIKPFQNDATGEETDPESTFTWFSNAFDFFTNMSANFLDNAYKNHQKMMDLKYPAQAAARDAALWPLPPQNAIEAPANPNNEIIGMYRYTIETPDGHVRSYSTTGTELATLHSTAEKTYIMISTILASIANVIVRFRQNTHVIVPFPGSPGSYADEYRKNNTIPWNDYWDDRSRQNYKKRNILEHYWEGASFEANDGKFTYRPDEKSRTFRQIWDEAWNDIALAIATGPTWWENKGRKDVQRAVGEALDASFNNSKYFTRDTGDGVKAISAGGMSTTMELVASLYGFESRVVPPWCMLRLQSVLHPNETYEQVRARYANDPGMAANCRDEKWMQANIYSRDQGSHPVVNTAASLWNKVFDFTNEAWNDTTSFFRSARAGAINSIWSIAYIAAGESLTEHGYSGSTIPQRMGEVELGIHPSPEEYMKAIVKKRATSAKTPIDSQSSFLDPQTDRWKYFDDPKLGEWEQLQKEADAWQMRNAPSVCKSGKADCKNTANLVTGLIEDTEEWRRQVSALAREMSYQRRDEEYLEYYQGDVSRIKFQSDYYRSLVYNEEPNPEHKRAFPRLYARRDAQQNPWLPPYNRTTGKLQPQQLSPLDWVYQNCLVADQYIGIYIGQFYQTTNYYLGYFPYVISGSVAYFNYTYDFNATAQVGYQGKGDPYLFSRTSPIGAAFQLSSYEIVYGVDYLQYFMNFVQSPEVWWGQGLIENGRLFTAVSNYWFSTQNGTYSGNIDAFFYVLGYINFEYNIPICQAIDTSMDLGPVPLYNLTEYIIFHTVVCQNTVDQNMAERNYSAFGGFLVVTFWLIILSLGASTILSFFAPSLLIVVNLAILTASLPIYLIVTYGWSFGCILPPWGAIYESFQLIVWTFFPRCNLFAGTLVLDEDYDLTNCVAKSLTASYAQCSAVVLTLADIVAIYSDYFGTPEDGSFWAFPNLVINAGNQLAPLLEFVGINNAVTVDVSAAHKSRAVQRVYGGCATLGVFALFAASTLLGLTLLALVVALIRPILAVIAILVFALPFTLMFLFYAMKYYFMRFHVMPEMRSRILQALDGELISVV